MPTIRTIRESLHISREELAVKAHVSMQTIIRLELGYNVPRHNTLKAIAKALKVQLSEIEFQDQREEL